MESHDRRNSQPPHSEGDRNLPMPLGEEGMAPTSPESICPVENSAPSELSLTDGSVLDVAADVLAPPDEGLAEGSPPDPASSEAAPNGEDPPRVDRSAASQEEPPLWQKLWFQRVAILTVLLAGAVFLLPLLRSCRESDPSDGIPTGTGDGTWMDITSDVLTDRELTPPDSEPEDTVTPTPDDSETSPETLAESLPDSAVDSSDTDSESVSPGESNAPADTDPLPSETETEPVESRTEAPPETWFETSPESLPETAPESEVETQPTRPDNAFSIVRKDLSLPDRSVGYIQSTADRLPPSIPAEGTRLWSTGAPPTVLLVHTHPYEGYHDGSDWYDPAAGLLSQTDTPSDPDGVVALGAVLTRRLREAGVTVIHLRVPVAEGESAAATYARTEETVRYYCELYPDIGLVLDLRRSAELSEDGEILRTAGQYQGRNCAQVRLSVSGDRPTALVSRDIALAVELRRALWAKEPTLSRPVWVKSGAGLAGELERVALLTVELGSSGNSYAEAEVLVDPLGEVIAALVKK